MDVCFGRRPITEGLRHRREYVCSNPTSQTPRDVRRQNMRETGHPCPDLEEIVFGVLINAKFVALGEAKIINIRRNTKEGSK